jgi:uncharacterized membrane protein (Fun14 family)
LEVGHVDDGAFLSHGYQEFLAMHAIGIDWFVVLWHEDSGVVTIECELLYELVSRSGCRQRFDLQIFDIGNKFFFSCR